MRASVAFLPALAAVASASPLVARQDIDFELVDSAPDPPTASIPIGATTQAVTYNLAKATASATASPLPVEKRNLKVRNACDPQPTGSGPVPVPDTASAFLAYASFSSLASAAPTPSGYANTFTNLQGSSGAYGYMGLTTLDTYDPALCASKCNAITGCVGINIYFERDPTVDPGTGCQNPPSTTVIKCTFWGGYVAAENAVNTGQWRNQFQIVIAGSNGYMSTAIPSIPGYTGVSLGNNAINAPLDCNGANTYMGSKIFTTSIFDPSLCAAACESQSAYNTRHPPSTGKPALCKFFNTYLMAENGRPQGQYCAMYTEPWAASYATNSGQYRGSDHYTIGYSFAYSNVTSPGRPVCPSDIAYLKTAGADFCTSYIGYSAPTTTAGATATATTTVITLTTVTDETTVTNYVTSTAIVNVPQRRDIATPASISGWEAASISSACSQVATGTLTTTATSTQTVATTLVSVITEKGTQTVIATTTTTTTAAASPTNLVTNGDFETCNTSGWSIIENTKAGGVVASAVAPQTDSTGNVDGGSCCLKLFSSYYEPWNGKTHMTFGQALATTRGVTYRVSWEMLGSGGDSNYWQVAINNKAPFASGNTGGDSYTWNSYTGTFVGTGSDTLIITAQSSTWGIAAWYYDNFVITPS